MSGAFAPLQGRWYARVEDANVHVERYLDVHDDILFQAVQYHRGGAYRTRQLVASLSAVEEDAGAVDLEVVRWMQDGVDRTPDLGGRILRGRFRVRNNELQLAVSMPGGDRPADPASGARFQRR